MGERSDLQPQAAGVYDIDYSTDHSIPRVQVPRNNGAYVEAGWVVTGEKSDENGTKYYKTERLEPIMQDGVPMRATKDIPMDELEALNGSLVERAGRVTPEEIGSIAVAASELVQPVEMQNGVHTAESATPSVESEVDAVVKQLEALNQDLSDSDRTALWRFGSALYPHEEESAIRSMSEELRTKTALRYQFQDLQRKLSALRK